MKTEPDFSVLNFSSFFMLEPITKAAHDWVAANLPDLSPWQWFGPNIAVEHRCINALVAGIRDDGLIVE